MCFYHDYDWYASVVEKDCRLAERSVACEIAGNPEDACKSLIAALKARKEAATHGK